MYPCKNCPDRCLGCHATCEKYKAAKQHHQGLTEHVHTAKVNNSIYHSKKWWWNKLNK